MIYLIPSLLALLLMLLGTWSLWDRFRRDDGIQEWMLSSPVYRGSVLIILTTSPR